MPDKEDVVDTSSYDEEEGPSFEPLPAGTRALFEVSTGDGHCEVRVGEKSGQPYVNFGAVVIEDENGGAFSGQYVWDMLAVSDKVLPRARHTYRMITGEALEVKGTRTDVATAIADGIRGCQFVGTVRIEKGQGGYDARSRFRKIEPAAEWQSVEDVLGEAESAKEELPF